MLCCYTYITQTCQYSYHWSAIIAIVYNHAGGTGSGVVDYALNNSKGAVGMKRHFTTSLKMDLYEPSVIKQMMQPGGTQEHSAFAREQRLLPKTRDSPEDKLAYTQFLGKFGTHYVSSAVLGR